MTVGEIVTYALTVITRRLRDRCSCNRHAAFQRGFVNANSSAGKGTSSQANGIVTTNLGNLPSGGGYCYHCRQGHKLGHSSTLPTLRSFNWNQVANNSTSTATTGVRQSHGRLEQ